MAFICSPSPSAYSPPPTPGRAALGLHSPSPRVCTGVRVGGWAYAPNFLGHMGLPKFLTHGAPLARFARRSSAIKISCSFFSTLLQEFHRNGERNGIDRHKTKRIDARYIRFNPTKRHGWNCLRVEVYGASELLFLHSTGML